MLLVDADEAEVRDRREDGGACTDDDGRLAGDDPLALVAALRLGQAGVQHGDPVAEAGLEASQRLRRQGDLGDEHDRALAPFEGGGAGLEIHLGLAAAGCAGEQQMRARSVHCPDDPGHRRLLRRRQLGRLGLAGHACAGVPPLAPPRAQLRSDELERPGRGRAVVVGKPEREVDERRRQLVEDALDRRRLDAVGRRDACFHDDPAGRRAAEADRDDCPFSDSGRHLVGEEARDGPGGDEWIDGREHPRQRRDGTRWPRRPARLD